MKSLLIVLGLVTGEPVYQVPHRSHAECLESLAALGLWHSYCVTPADDRARFVPKGWEMQMAAPEDGGVAR